MMRFLSGSPRRLPDQDCLELPNTTYPFRIRASTRRSTLALELHADGALTVAAPAACPLAIIREFVASHRLWIDRQRARLARLPAARPALVHGVRLPYLGTTLTLHHHVTDGRRVLCRREGDALIVHAADPAGLHRGVTDWYRRAAETHFQDRLAHFGARIGCAPKRLTVRAARTRWGSCSARGTISLNWRLMQAPPELVDYVVVHELCHLRIPNHSPRFWAEVARILPHWRELRVALHSPGAWLAF
jgi:predicted metal-dependent hydrolase